MFCHCTRAQSKFQECKVTGMTENLRKARKFSRVKIKAYLVIKATRLQCMMDCPMLNGDPVQCSSQKKSQCGGITRKQYRSRVVPLTN